MLIVAPVSVFFLLFVYGLPNLVYLAWHEPGALLTAPAGLLAYPLLGLFWGLAYRWGASVARRDRLERTEP